MSSGPVLKPMAVCESCWLLDHARWEPESMDNTGNILMKLVGVDVPEKVNTGEVEVCCMCGGLTICGIYEFKDPEKVYFTDENKNEYELEMQDFGFEEDMNEE